MPEAVDRRALGAVRFVDAVTRTEVTSSLSVQAPGVTWSRNSRGWFVLRSVPALRLHTHAFLAPPSDVALGDVDVELTVRDPGGTYLPRRRVVALPRSADPARAGAGDSVFTPAEVRMFRAPAAPMAPGWAVVRTTVVAAGSGRRLGGALVRVLTAAAPPAVLATGLTDGRGEGVVVLPDVPVTTFGSGPQVLATELTVDVEAVVVPGSPALPDPDVLTAQAGSDAARRVTLSNVRLASGRIVVLSMSIPL